MRIAQIAPLYESVPPKLYGGTERVVSYLTDELVKQGHDVVLFASGDSVTRARLVPVSRKALRLEGPHVMDPIAHHVRMLEMVNRQLLDFDLVHFHIDYLHFPLVPRYPVAALNEFLGKALCVLFPIDWPEPFGLVMIEAMACGTPTIAFRRGSVPEMLEDKKTGFIVDNLQDAINAVDRVYLLNRRTCREVFQQRFSASRMAREYLAILQDSPVGRKKSSCREA